MEKFPEEKPGEPKRDPQRRPKRHLFRNLLIVCIAAAAVYRLTTAAVVPFTGAENKGENPFPEETSSDVQEETLDGYEAYWAEQGTYEARELTEPEVVQGGVHCSYYGHSAVDGETAKTAAEDLLREQGYEETKAERIPYNERVTYEGGAERTVYNISYYYELTAHDKDSKTLKNGFHDSVEVGYDTATGEAHYIIVYSGNVDFIVSAAKAMTACLDSRDPEARPDEAMMEEELRRQMSAEDGSYWMTNKNWELYAYREPSGYSLSISALY